MIKLSRWDGHKLQCVHVTYNHVPRRGALFLAGAIVLAAMWAIFILRMLLGLG